MAYDHFTAGHGIGFTSVSHRRGGRILIKTKNSSNAKFILIIYIIYYFRNMDYFDRPYLETQSIDCEANCSR